MRITGQQVIAFTADHYGIPMADFLGPRRTKSLARPRQIAMWLCRKYCPHLSYPELGRRLGGRDHTTIICGVRRVELLLATDPDQAEEIAQVDRKLRIATGLAFERAPIDWPTQSVSLSFVSNPSWRATL